jgi:hypothetical protein
LGNISSFAAALAPKNKLRLNFMQIKKIDWNFAVIISVFILAILLIPHGEFAINDDWLYYQTVKQALAGNWHPDIFVGPSLILQAFFGFLLSSIFGFSFSVLKFFTISLSFLALAAFYLLIKKISNKKIALFSALLLFANPWFLLLSFSFMTDIPAFSFFIFSLYFLLTGWDKNKYYSSWLGVLCLGAAIFIRQSYAVVLAAFFLASLAELFYQEEKIKYFFRFVFRALLPSAIIALVFWLVNSGGLWPKQTVINHEAGNVLLNFSLWPQNLFTALSYLALFCSPALIIFLGRQKKYFIGFISAIAFFCLWFFGYEFPRALGGEIINVFSLGPNGRNLLLDGTPPAIFGPVIWLLIGLWSGYFVIYFLSAWGAQVKKNWQKKYSGQIIFLTLSALGLLILFLNFISFDRYLLPLLAIFLLVFFYREENVVPKKISWILLLIFLAVSFIGVRNYLLVEQEKWIMADSLAAAGEQIKNIDGGYEWSLWHWYLKQDPTILSFYQPAWPWYITSLIPDNQRTDIISFDSQKDGYHLEDKKCVDAWASKNNCLYAWRIDK